MPLRNKKFLAAGLTCLVLLISAGCSSNSSSPTTTTGGGGSNTSKTYTLGLITDLTGPGASEAATSVDGVKAAIGVAATEGYKINYVTADTATTTTGALSGAQKLVEQDHVFAVLGVSSLLFSAAPYLLENKVPVIGGAFDASEWLEPKYYNMFSVIGNEDYTKVYTTTGLFLKSQGRHQARVPSATRSPPARRRRPDRPACRPRPRVSIPPTSMTASPSAAPTCSRSPWP